MLYLHMIQILIEIQFIAAFDYKAKYDNYVIFQITTLLSSKSLPDIDINDYTKYFDY